VHIVAARLAGALMVGSTFFLKIKEREELLHGDQNGHNTPTLPAKPSNTNKRRAAPLDSITITHNPHAHEKHKRQKPQHSIGGHKINILPNHIPKPSHSLDHQQQSHPSTADHGHPSVSGYG